MRFGLSFLPDAAPHTKPAETYFADALALCDLADRGGLDTVKMTEHYLHPYGGYCPNPLSFLSAVAARTRRIRLMTGCLLPAFHHPIQIASEAAMLDAISGGRADIGFARAYLPYEFESFGVPLDQSRDRFVATVHAVVRLWTEANVSIDTPFFSFRDARCLPRPVQQPHPPIWGAAVRSRESFAWLGEQGYNLLVTPSLGSYDSLADLIGVYRESFSDAHRDPTARPQVAVSLPLYIAESDRRALVEGESYLQKYVDVWADAAAAWASTRSTDYPGYTGLASAIRNHPPRAMIEHGAALFGCPERIGEGIHRLKDELEVDQILWQIDFGSMPMGPALRSLTIFIDNIIYNL